MPNRGLCDCPPDTRGDACNGTCPRGQAELRRRAAEELAAEFGNDVEEWLV